MVMRESYSVQTRYGADRVVYTVILDRDHQHSRPSFVRQSVLPVPAWLHMISCGVCADGRGGLTKDEILKSVLKSGIDVLPGEMEELMIACDANKDGVISFDEFQKGVMSLGEKTKQGRGSTATPRYRQAPPGR